MTSKKSSVNAFGFTYLNTIKKNCLIPILVFFFNLVYQLYTPIVYYYNEKYTGALGYGLNKIVYAFTNPAIDFFGVIFNAGLLLCPFVTAALIYKYQMNKSAVNVYFSLGVKRTTMFFAKFSAGCTMVVAAQIIPFISALIANLILFGSHQEMWRSFIFILLNYIVLEIFIFAVTAATFALVGTVVEGLAYSVVFTSAPAVIAVYIRFLFRHFLVGFIDNDIAWTSSTNNFKVLGVGVVEASRFDFYDFVCNFIFFPYSSVNTRYKLIKGPYTWEALDYKPLVFWTILTALIVVFGWLAYKNRKAEIAGFMGANQKATFAGSFLVATFLSSCLLPELIPTDTALEKAILVLFTILIFLIVYLVIDIISLRNFKKIGKGLWKLPIQLAVYFLGIVVFVTGFFGFKSRVPSIDKIESVSIQTETGDILITPSNLGFKDYYYEANDFYLPLYFMTNEDRNYQLVGGFDSEEDIQRAIDIHKMLIDVSGDTVDGVTVAKAYGERIRPVSIQIIYHLKNGKTFQRTYSVANDEILCKLAEFTESERYKELVLKSIDYKTSYITYGGNDNNADYEIISDYIYDDYLGCETIGSSKYQVGFATSDLTKITPYSEIQYAYNLKDDILQVIEKDIREGSLPLNLSSKEKVLGYIVFKNFNLVPDVEYEYATDEYYYYDYGVPEMDAEVVYVDDKALLEDDCYLAACEADSIMIPVYENMTNTVKFINDNGLSEYFVGNKTPYAVKIWDGVTTVNSDRMYMFSNKTMLFSGVHYKAEYSDKYVEINIPDEAQVITQPEQIAEYEDKAQMLYLTCYDGVYAQFLYEDGSSSFAYIPK